MKVVGKTKEGFSLNATTQELATLIGPRSKFKVKDIQVGTDIAIYRIYFPSTGRQGIEHLYIFPYDSPNPKHSLTREGE